MSSMLEQAMIDAEALRETAMKNAESIIIDKYSADVKKVVQSLLEQDDFDLEGESEEEALGAAADEADPDTRRSCSFRHILPALKAEKKLMLSATPSALPKKL